MGHVVHRGVASVRGFDCQIAPKNWNISTKLGQKLDFIKAHGTSWFIFLFYAAFKGYEGFKGQIDSQSR